MTRLLNDMSGIYPFRLKGVRSSPRNKRLALIIDLILGLDSSDQSFQESTLNITLNVLRQTLLAGKAMHL
jgi:hypothetical protein